MATLLEVLGSGEAGLLLLQQPRQDGLHTRDAGLLRQLRVRLRGLPEVQGESVDEVRQLLREAHREERLKRKAFRPLGLKLTYS